MYRGKPYQDQEENFFTPIRSHDHFPPQSSKKRSGSSLASFDFEEDNTAYLYSVTSHDVNFCYPDQMRQTEFVHITKKVSAICA
jgi:hypothetical protein